MILSVCCRSALLSLVIFTIIIYFLSTLWSFKKTNSIVPQQVKSQKIHCDWNKFIAKTPNDIYELNLNYKIHENASFSNPYGVPSILESKVKINGTNRLLEFDDLQQIPDNEWMPNFDRSVYELYPQALPLKETIHKVITNEPLPVIPINNPNIRYLRVPSQVCPPIETEFFERLPIDLPHHDIIIIYKSGVYNFESRDKIRNFYHFDKYDLKIDLVFSIGMPTTMKENLFQRDGFNITLTGRSGQKLTQHLQFPEKTHEKLQKEMQDYDDLLIGDYEDTYYNLTLKLFHSFQWASRFCRPYSPVFVFIDDDYAVNPKQLVNYLKRKSPDELKLLNYGYDMIENVVHRENGRYPRWAFSKREIPWPVHPPEYLGVYSLLGSSVVQDIGLGMYFTKPIVVDDTYMAMIMNKLGLKLTRLKGMTFGNVPSTSNYTCDDLLFADISVFEKHNCSF